MHALSFHTPAILKRGKLLKERLNTAPQHLVNLNDPSLQSPSNQRLTTFPITLPAAPMGTPYQTRATAARKKTFPRSRPLLATSVFTEGTWTTHVTAVLLFRVSTLLWARENGGGLRRVRRVSHPRADPPPGGISFMIPKRTHPREKSVSRVSQSKGCARASLIHYRRKKRVAVTPLSVYFSPLALSLGSCRMTSGD